MSIDAVVEDYSRLLQDYLEKTLSATAFETAYINKFSNEQRELDEATYEMLNGLFL